MSGNLIAIVALSLCALASFSEAKGCLQNGKFYKIGSSWVQGNTVCTCKLIGTNVRVVCERRLGKCDAWGDPHFTSFDGRKFNFQGICRYILSRDCCGNNFTIEVEQTPYSPTTSVTDKFTIRFGTRVVDLEKIQVLTVDGLTVPGLFHDDADVRCEVISGYITVTLKQLNIWFRWNWQYHVQVFAHPQYEGHLCGLCADFNGDPSNDLSLTPTGEPVSTIPEWGESWRTQRQPKRCEGTEPSVGNNDDKECETNPKFVEEIEKCETIMMGPIFSQCRRRLNVKNYIDDCETEICECLKMGRKDCVCTAVSALERDCEDLGVVISDEWKLEHGCGVCVVRGVVYEHGQTYRVGCYVYKCNNGKISLFQQLKGCCFDKDTRQWYMNGQKWSVGCEIRTCDNGKIVPEMDKNCCVRRGKYYEPGHIIVGKCVNSVCRGGRWLSIRTCCYYNRKLYNVGAMWKDGCKTCRCYPGPRVHCYWSKFVICLPPRKLNSACQCVLPAIITKEKAISLG